MLRWKFDEASGSALCWTVVQAVRFVLFYNNSIKKRLSICCIVNGLSKKPFVL